MLDIQHARDWSNSAKLVNGEAAVEIKFHAKDESFSGFLQISS